MSLLRNATAHWYGRGSDGLGQLDTGSAVLQHTPYSYTTRFAEGVGTNPEELIAAAHAGCLSMKLAFNLQVAGYTATHINTRCEVAMREGMVTESALTVEALVPGLSPERFQELVADAQQNCAVSKLLNAAIRCEATLLPSVVA
ncbi:osmotically inducible protein OsmC [Hymenobacter gelipurpurascens]|uniref:Osmotically inducible protein OsmC n=1 Tax=Hymenobacter gelipurpurascens TaxID=89968 RepID=A0A212T4F4_9BACT|nr:OsmC family peroxiredoxin [Hymenobacter gelipurpurascens]SNC60716.1 osmotically inducible protein OsmC [Hymenobacter gelipurpurascens]